VGETRRLSNGLKVQLVDVTEDSRCPEGVDCAEIGRIVTQFKVTQDNSNLGIIELSGPPFSTPNSNGSYNNQHVNMAGYHFILDSVEPYPVVPPYPQPIKEIEKSDYKATLRIEQIQRQSSNLGPN
jgi:hypothetical protein